MATKLSFPTYREKQNPESNIAPGILYTATNSNTKYG